MKTVHRRFVWLYLVTLTAALAVSLFSATPGPQDDHALYQKFIEALAAGKLDLTIPGFHGTDVFGLLVYFFTHSPIAQIYGLLIAAVLLPVLGFFAGRAIYQDDLHGMLLAAIVAMMPFISFVGLRGWTGAGYWVWMLLTIILAGRRSAWTGVTWGLAMLSKPFAVILLPLIIVLFTDEKPHGFFTWIRAWRLKQRSHPLFPVAIGILIVAVYLLIQWLQAGRIFIGAHEEIGAGAFMQGPERIGLNLAHSLQILFSIHNYYFPDPALTGPGNMMHTSPVLIFLGLFALFTPATYFSDWRISRALLVGAIIGIVMNALLDHMDHFYMEASLLLLILASLPVLRRHLLWIPLALATLHFQWFYFFLQYRPGFSLDWTFFLVPAVVDLWLIGFCATQWKRAWTSLKQTL